MKYAKFVLPALGAVLLVLWGMNLWREKRAAEDLAGYYKQVNDSTVAEVAAWKAKAHSLEALKDAAKKEKGGLVAGVEIRTKPDTVYVPVHDVVTVTKDETRTASLTDTTKMGIEVEVSAEAPPAPADLKLGYRITVPEFHPQVGFLKKGDSYVALVSWAGQEFTIEDAFHLPEKKAPRFALIAGASEFATLDGKLLSPEGYGGVNLRVSKKDWIGLVGRMGWQAGARVGIRWERNLWER